MRVKNGMHTNRLVVCFISTMFGWHFTNEGHSKVVFNQQLASNLYYDVICCYKITYLNKVNKSYQIEI